MAATLLATTPSLAALKAGAAAPDFSDPATIGGTVFPFSLADALKKGPVVLYFYPAAFTSGCTEEAHEFAEAVPQFHALGATVIGVSQDGIKKLQKFSVSECRSKFAVASDADGHVSKAYDAVFSSMMGLSDRTSYVIAPDGHILTAYHAMDPTGHVNATLAAVKTWKGSH
jgi:peroxiredoxin